MHSTSFHITHFVLFCLLSFVMTTGGFAQKKHTAMPVLTHKSQLAAHIGQEVCVEGVLRTRKYIDKAGRTSDFEEPWLEMEAEEWVLVRATSTHLLAQLPYDRKVQLVGKVFYGSVDSDDPQVQSRIGYRIDWKEIKIVEK
jgi:hypothetical protein